MWTILYFILVLTATRAQQCDDIDSSACQLMHSSRPNLCSDQTIAKTACPRFCKLCPVKCYHCNATLLDYHMCSTTVLCKDGEVCMKKELKSFIDGHHEYELKCEAKQLCDGGSDLTFTFGKRHLQKSRDLTVTCCADDLCNYPDNSNTLQTTSKPSTSTAHVCYKDIVFMVDQSDRFQATEYSDAIGVILEVVKRLDIGSSENLVALYGFDQSVHDRIPLQQHTEKNSLLSDLHHEQHQQHLSDRHPDLSNAIDELVNHILTRREGDRTSYPDAVVIIGDSRTAQNVHLTFSQSEDLLRASKDVITLSVMDSSSSVGNFDALASDQNHVIHVTNLRSQEASIVDKLVALIQQC